MKRNQLNTNLVQLKSDGTSKQKLDALKMIEELINPHVRVCETGRYLHLSFDRAVRSNKNLIALTFTSDQSRFIPNSLLNLKSSKQTGFPISYEVIHIFKIPNNLKEKVPILPCKESYQNIAGSYLKKINF
ncbi:hypothetical protein Y229_14775 [Listeria monocytogenes]|nr:hypothetical protein [Listeria monocytogenes]